MNHTINLITSAYQIHRSMFAEALRNPALSGSADTRLLSYFLSLNLTTFTWTVEVIKLHTCWVNILRRTRSWWTVSTHLSSWTFGSLSTVRPFSPALSPLFFPFRRLYFPGFIRIFVLLFRMVLWIFALT